MNDIRGRYFIKNNQQFTVESFDLCDNSNKSIIYEVIRVIDGKILFYNDHLERFQNSLLKFGYSEAISKQAIGEQLLLLMACNGIENGNIKFLFAFSDNSNFYAFFIPHKYPSTSEYANGIYLSTLFAERLSPHIKQQNDILNRKVQDQLNITKAYEILLVDVNGNVTEGSKSNFFLIKDNKLFTASEKEILPGITRKYVLYLCKQLGIKIIEMRINFGELDNFDAAFISGTSPKILPVSTINSISFDVKNSFLRELMEGFDRIIEENLVNLEKI